MTSPASGAADVVLSVKHVHDFADAHGDDASVLAISNGVVEATGRRLDDVSHLIGPGTRVIREEELVLVPGFFDTHNHLFMTSADVRRVEISDCRSISEIVERLHERARELPPGEWVVANRGWHESTIEERRLPTALELDAVSREHPVYVPRGGHVGTANTYALDLSGVTAMKDDPPGGTIVRDEHGTALGPLIEFPATYRILRFLPGDGRQSDPGMLKTAMDGYVARGITAVRDPGIDASNLAVYRQLHADEGLPLRARVLMRLDAFNSAEQNLTQLDEYESLRNQQDDVLRVEGIKIIADGGVEGGWFSDPYVNRADFCGHAFYSREELESLVETAVRRGWKVGTHAVGDNAVRLVLDVYESVLAKVGAVKPGSLVIEHAFMADAQSRARAVAAGIRVTVQHPLLYFLGGNMLTHWGPERTAQVMPVAEWLADGGLIAGGSDCNVAPYDPLLAIWGFTTRGTKVAGVQGPSQAVDRRTAFSLYTEAGWRLTGEEHERGRLLPGFSADLVAYRQDPMTVDLDDLPSLSPAFTLMAGHPVHDPEGYFHDVV